jgi:hypothetical protein
MARNAKGAGVKFNTILREYESPSGRYSCRVSMVLNESGEREDGERVFIISSANPEKCEFVFESIRYVDIEWAPDDQFFAILDYNDGHTIALQIFMITEITEPKSSQNTTSEDKLLMVEKVYCSPSAGRYDSYWRIDSWDIAEGTVRIECSFLADEDWLRRPMKFTKRSYVVPIGYKSFKAQSLSAGGQPGVIHK